MEHEGRAFAPGGRPLRLFCSSSKCSSSNSPPPLLPLREDLKLLLIDERDKSGGSVNEQRWPGNDMKGKKRGKLVSGWHRTN